MCWGWVKKPVAFCITSLSAGYAPDFSSENVKIKAARDQTEQALIGYEGAKTWVIEGGFGGGDVWWDIWKHPHSHLVNRVVLMERFARGQTASGKWEECVLDATIC